MLRGSKHISVGYLAAIVAVSVGIGFFAGYWVAHTLQVGALPRDLFPPGRPLPTTYALDAMLGAYQAQRTVEGRVRALKDLLEVLGLSTDLVGDSSKMDYIFSRRLPSLYRDTHDEAILIAVDETPIDGSFANYVCGFYMAIATEEEFRERYGRNPEQAFALKRCAGLSFGWSEMDELLGRTDPVESTATQSGGSDEPGPSSDSLSPNMVANTIDMKLARLPSGSFTMGSDEDMINVRPTHQVTLLRPFYIGVCEVTQEQWEKVMGYNPSWFKGPDLPVDSVSWNQAQVFCERLSRIENATYRLPTEAEWEYACRAGANTLYYWGNRFPENGVEWWAGNADSVPHEVGELSPNDWGLHDMAGNVREWCADWYGEAKSGDPQTDPQGPDAGSRRVTRGGSWRSWPGYLRSAICGHALPDCRQPDMGFRVVRLCDTPRTDLSQQGELQGKVPE